MLDVAIATVRPVSEDEATGKVAAIYADIKATKGINMCPISGGSWPPIPIISR